MMLREIEEMRRDMEEREIEVMKDIDATKSEIITMKAEMDAITKELEALLDAKLSLELEIATYKKLLEGEADGEGLRQVVDNMFDSYASATASAAAAYADGIYGEGYNGSAAGFSSSELFIYLYLGALFKLLKLDKNKSLIKPLEMLS